MDPSLVDDAQALDQQRPTLARDVGPDVAVRELQGAGVGLGGPHPRARAPAGDGELALTIIQDVKPDILITDIKMPFMDGLTLARHAEVAALWYDGSLVPAKALEAASAGNLKYMWNYGAVADWTALSGAEAREAIQQSVQVKNIWIPYGE